MSDFQVCAKHGAFPSGLGACPHCVREMGGLPPSPPSLEQDDTFGGVRASASYRDDDETVLPGVPSSTAGASFGVEDVTELPQRGGSAAGFEDDVTQLPERKRRILDSDADEDDDIDDTVIKREDTSVMGWLIVKKGYSLRRGHILKIRPGAILGRNPKKADVLIDDENVSGLHARIQLKDSQFVVVDLGSANGTWVNGEEVLAPKVIHQDDEIRLGDTIFVLKTL